MPGCEQKQARSGHSPPAQAEHAVWTFRSRPDLSLPLVEVNTQAHKTTLDYIFLEEVSKFKSCYPEWEFKYDVRDMLEQVRAKTTKRCKN